MTKMKTLTKGLLGASVFSLLASGNAFALGTAAGTNVENTFTLDYQVSGVDQPTIDTGPTGTDTPTEFTVDRLIDLTVASTGDATVAPGATDEALVYSVTNTGNDTQAYDLVLVNEAAGDDFDATGLTVLYYVDDGDGIFEPDTGSGGDDGIGIAYTPGDDTLDVPADAMIWVVVEGDIPVAATDGQTSDITLVADTLEPTTGTTPGAPVVADTGGNTLTGVAENVLGDGTGTTNEIAGAGDHSATGAYIVASADVTAAKTVSVFSQDGAGCATIPGTPGTDPLSIPGSCVEYVITATNDAGATADATEIDISDFLPQELEFVTAQHTGFTAGTFAAPAGGTDCSPTPTTCEVSLTGATLIPGATGTITIRALVL